MPSRAVSKMAAGAGSGSGNVGSLAIKLWDRCVFKPSAWLYHNPVVLSLVVIYCTINYHTVWPAAKTLALEFRLYWLAGATGLLLSWIWASFQVRRQASSKADRVQQNIQPGQVKARLEQQAQADDTAPQSLAAQSTSTPTQELCGEQEQEGEKGMGKRRRVQQQQPKRDFEALNHGRRKWCEQLQQQADEAAAAARQRALQDQAPNTPAKPSGPAAASSYVPSGPTISTTSSSQPMAAAAGGPSPSSANPRQTPTPARPAPAPSRMIDRQTALEAEAQQQRWLQQLNTQLSAGGLQGHAQLQESRQLRQEQDEAFEASLAADRARAAAEEAEAEARRAKTRRLIELNELKSQLKASTPDEPDEGDKQAAEGDGPVVVQLRVRLPDGSSHVRRWLSNAPLSQVYDWVYSLDAFPLWELSEWQLACAYPRQLLPREDDKPLSEVVAGEKSFALLVERL